MNTAPSTQTLRLYLLFLSGQLVSLLGSSIVNFAIIWWLTLSAKAQYPDSVGLVLGIASFLGFGPMVVTSLFAGVFVDRWNRKIVIAAVDSLEALFAGILMILFFVDGFKSRATYSYLVLYSNFKSFTTILYSNSYTIIR